MIRTTRTSTVLLLGSIALASSTGPLSAQDLSDVEITTIPVADGVWMLQGAGGNVGVSAGEDGVILVDDQYAPMTDRILEAVRALGHGEPRFVLNTHWHGDHTGGNENLGEAGALIVAHRNVRARMGVEQVLEALGRTVPASPEGALPVLTFHHAVDLHLNGDSIAVRHAPHAHTDGDAVVDFTRADVLHLGDVFFNGSYPFIDLESGGSVQGLLAAVDRALERAGAETRIIPGHGPLADREDLRRYREVVGAVTERVRTLREEGRGLEEVLAADPGAEWDATWGGGFIGPEAFVTSVYRSLERWSDRAGGHHPHDSRVRHHP